jgi:hypothetical protein
MNSPRSVFYRIFSGFLQRLGLLKWAAVTRPDFWFWIQFSRKIMFSQFLCLKSLPHEPKPSFGRCLRGNYAAPIFFAESMPKIENPALSLQPILIGRGVGKNQKRSYKKRCEDYSFKKIQIVRSAGQNGQNTLSGQNLDQDHWFPYTNTSEMSTNNPTRAFFFSTIFSS